MVRLIGPVRLWWLLTRMRLTLPGRFVQAVRLDTGETLVLRRTAPMFYGIYLLGASPLIPLVAVEETMLLSQVSFWYPSYALRLNNRWDGAAWPTSREFDRLLAL